MYTYLDTDRQIVLLYALVVQRVIHLYVGPRVSVLRSLLQIERVEFVGLRRGPGHQAVEHRRITFDARTGGVDPLKMQHGKGGYGFSRETERAEGIINLCTLQRMGEWLQVIVSTGVKN